MTLAKKQRAEDDELLKRLKASAHAKYMEWSQLLHSTSRQERITNKSRDKVTKSVEKFVAFKDDALRGLPSRFENIVDAQVSEEVSEDEQEEEGEAGEAGGEQEEGDTGPVTDSEEDEDDVARAARDGN